ncbi:RNA-binding transcriptional accessory protein [Membranicola marinus]|uniref:RNA-binding transcriptional accessory protein n=1 Tax=Membranihabitans marinus TaxID=1227546 RepID=A0A953LAH8_9BACT|nr:Tex family protein [Membranihabitans marinus]MBY5958723.1 RNA-binding transcriptional accessory protein [Membranihabitans marinus]
MISKIISQQSGIAINQVNPVINLLNEGATIPFIARYRKEQTGSLDEVAVSTIQNEYKKLQDLIKRKESILKSIEEQGELTDRLRTTIGKCWDDKKLEDLYLPFKRKTQTKAAKARKAGYEGLAKIIMAQKSHNVREQAERFGKAEDAIEGAQHIIAEWVSENPAVRNIIRNIFSRKGMLHARMVKDMEKKGEKFKDYFDSNEYLNKMPSHRLLAVLRGEAEGVLKVKVDVEFEEVMDRIGRYYIKKDSDAVPYLEAAIHDALKRLILPSIRNEVLKDAKEKADEEAIRVFTRNAAELLLSPPLGAKRILGIDPGFRTGCKVVCLDDSGNLLYHTTVYPHPPQNQITKAEEMIVKLAHKYKIQAIAIGDGTAGRETYQWLRKTTLNENTEIFLINEDGASIYSASELAREEFPDKDITVRGAVSIARRLMDPLAELVKIDPKSIGVGQYQHDVNQKKLKESLTETVEFCVNKVGINVNTASKHLLSYVSGLGPTLAGNIIEYRTTKGRINSIESLKEVPRLGEKAFEQCAGFLRVKKGLNPLDNTGVHPEVYGLVHRMAHDLGKTTEQLVANDEILQTIDLTKYITPETGLPTLNDIIKELSKPGLDPRSKATPREFTAGLERIDDLSNGQIVQGVVTNLTKFGAFLDIGIKESALLHISQIADRFISDPAEELSINQEVKVKVLEVDISRKRISVTRKGM